MSKTQGFGICTVLNVTINLYCDRDDAHLDSNLRVGLLVVVSFFLVVSVLAFPNGKLFNKIYFELKPAGVTEFSPHAGYLVFSGVLLPFPAPLTEINNSRTLSAHFKIQESTCL